MCIEYGSEDFEEFLGVLGEKIQLKSWERYRGGLDVKGIYRKNERKDFFLSFTLSAGDMTGKYSVYTLYEGHEIMFHVSTLLPFSRDNKQQVGWYYFIADLYSVFFFYFYKNSFNFK